MRVSRQWRGFECREQVFPNQVELCLCGRITRRYGKHGILVRHHDNKLAECTAGPIGIVPPVPKKVADAGVARGRFFMIFATRERALRYIYCVCISLPIWFVVGILLTQSPELGKALGATETLSAGKGIMLCYIGTSLGEVGASLIAQATRSRRISMLVFHILSLVMVFLYLGSTGITPEKFAWLKNTGPQKQ